MPRQKKTYMDEVKDVIASAITNLEGKVGRERLVQNRKDIDHLQPFSLSSLDEERLSAQEIKDDLYLAEITNRLCMYGIKFGNASKPCRFVEWREMDYGRKTDKGDFKAVKNVYCADFNRILFHCEKVCESYEAAGMSRPVLWVIGFDDNSKPIFSKRYDQLFA